MYVTATELFHRDGDNSVAVFSLYESAAKLGYSRAIGSMGWCYETGYGVKQDSKNALAWFERAVEMGDDTSIYNLARRDIISKRDAAKGVARIERVVKSNFGTMQLFLSIVYSMDEYVPHDMRKSVEYAIRATASGTYCDVFEKRLVSDESFAAYVQYVRDEIQPPGAPKSPPGGMVL